MHDDACANRVTAEVTAEAVELKLLAEVRATKSLTQGTRALGARVHMLPERPRDVEDDTVESIDNLLREVSPDLRLKR